MSSPSFFNQTSSKLLIHEPPLQVLPSLAVKIGLNEAMVLQQIHYWISNPLNKNIVNDRRWVYNTYEDWNKQFPFWSKDTVIRTLKSLELKKLVISGTFNKATWDRTKWYTIDYESLSCLDICPSTKNGYIEVGKLNSAKYANCEDGGRQIEQMPLCKLPNSNTIDYLPETISKITTETNNVHLKNFEKEFEEFWSAYDNKKGKEKCYKAYKKLLEDKGVGLHDNIMYAISSQRDERDSADALGLWQPARKMPLTWLNAQCWEDEVKTREQLNDERQREVYKLSRKPRAMSAADQYHELNTRIGEAADRKLAEINAAIRARGEEPDEDDEIDF